MNRLFLFVLLLLGAVGAGPAAAQTGEAGLPPRPTPFKFVNDEASLMQPADAKKLDSGLRRYADNTGTQIVVVTVPSLGGRAVADYARALGTAWGVGQRDKNNGIVVLLGAQERKVSIQPGSGLAGVITPEVTSRVINEMTPGFKQNNYFAGFRAGLNTLMATANPASAKEAAANNAASATTGAATAAVGSDAAAGSPAANLSSETQYPASTGGNDPVASAPNQPASPGFGLLPLLIGALVIGGILWFVVRMFKNRSAAAGNQNSYPNQGNQPNNQGGAPNFLPNGNRPNGPTGGNYNQNPGNYGPGYGQAPNSGGGMGMGGMLATGAAAAAGAYLGNRMASGHDTSGNGLMNEGHSDGSNAGTNLGGAGLGAAGAGAAASAGSDYFSSRDGGGNEDSAPDYFSDANTAADNSNDYFSSDDNSSYDDTSSGDTGGGGFDDTNDNSGSW